MELTGRLFRGQLGIERSQSSFASATGEGEDPVLEPSAPTLSGGEAL